MDRVIKDGAEATQALIDFLGLVDNHLSTFQIKAKAAQTFLAAVEAITPLTLATAQESPISNARIATVVSTFGDLLNIAGEWFKPTLMNSPEAAIICRAKSACARFSYVYLDEVGREEVQT